MGGIASDIVSDTLLPTQRCLLDSFFGMEYPGSALDLGQLVKRSATTLRLDSLPPSDFLSWIGVVVIAQVGPDRISDMSIAIANVSHSICLLIVTDVSITVDVSNTFQSLRATEHA